jgi:hypothetical protein
VTAEVSVSVDVAASVEVAFSAMVDLASQDRWMLGTKLFPLQGEVPVPGVGSRMAALTGIGGIGVLDTMVVTVFDPPHRWETTHTGNAFKGVGIFSVEPRGDGARITWTEQIELPLGVLGRLGWPAAKPLVRWGVAKSLRSLKKGILDGTLPVNPPSQ